MFRGTSEFDRWRVFLRAFGFPRHPSVSLWRRCSFGSRQIKRIYHHLQACVSRITCQNVVALLSPPKNESHPMPTTRSAIHKRLRGPVTSGKSHDRKMPRSLKDATHSSDRSSVSLPRCRPLEQSLVSLQANSLLNIGISLYYFVRLGEIRIDRPSSPTWLFYLVLMSLTVVERR